MTHSELQNGIIMWKYWPFCFMIFLWKTSGFSSKETVRCVSRSQARFSETMTFQHWLIRCNHNMQNQWRKYLQLIIFLMAMTTSQWNKSTSNKNLTAASCFLQILTVSLFTMGLSEQFCCYFIHLLWQVRSRLSSN